MGSNPLWISFSGNYSSSEWDKYWKENGGATATTDVASVSTDLLSYTLPSYGGVAQVDQLDQLLQNEEWVNTDGDDALNLDELESAREKISLYLNQKVLTGLTSQDIALSQQLMTLTFLTDTAYGNNKSNFELLAGGADSITFSSTVIQSMSDKFGSTLDQNEINQFNINSDEFALEALNTLFKGHESLSESDLEDIAEDPITLDPWDEGYELNQKTKLLAQTLLEHFDAIAKTQEFGSDQDHELISLDEAKALFAQSGSGSLYTADDLTFLARNQSLRTTTKTLMVSVFEQAQLGMVNADEQKAKLQAYAVQLQQDLVKDPNDKNKSDLFRNANTLLQQWEMLSLLSDGKVDLTDIDTKLAANGLVDGNKAFAQIAKPFGSPNTSQGSILNILLSYLNKPSLTLFELKTVLAYPPKTEVMSYDEYGPSNQAMPIFSDDELKTLETLASYLQLTGFNGVIQHKTFQ